MSVARELSRDRTQLGEIASVITSEGKINLSSGNIVGLSGLDGYYNLKHLDSLEYVRNLNDFNLDE